MISSRLYIRPHVPVDIIRVFNLYVHVEKTGHENVSIDHFEILSNGYKNNKFKRKVAETLHIKHERPTLNVQEQSVSLKLFNGRGPEV